MNISDLQSFCSHGSIRWTMHVLKRLLQRNISQAEVVQTIFSGEIIEQYPDDYPYPSCLLLGHTDTGRPLHDVCGLTDSEVWLITAYEPTQTEWGSDLKTRKKVLQ